MDQRELRGLRTYALYCIVAAALLAVVFLFYFRRSKTFRNKPKRSSLK